MTDLVQAIHAQLGKRSPGETVINTVLNAQSQVVQTTLTQPKNRPEIQLPGIGKLVSCYPARSRKGHVYGIPRAVYFWPGELLQRVVADTHRHDER